MERILVIYDDPRSEQTVRRILEPAGYDVITVPLTPIALGVFHKTSPGLSFSMFVGQQSRVKIFVVGLGVNSDSVPLLVLSGGGGVADVVLLLTLGADGYITKPFSPDEFMARVRAAMRHLIS